MEDIQNLSDRQRKRFWEKRKKRYKKIPLPLKNFHYNPIIPPSINTDNDKILPTDVSYANRLIKTTSILLKKISNKRYVIFILTFFINSYYYCIL
jgi:hypothetical protein